MFVEWSDGVTDNPRTVIVTQDLTLQAVFAEKYYTITVTSNDTTMGNVTGSGQYQAFTFAGIGAEPNVGYTFLCWNDGSTQPQRSILVYGDASYQAIFSQPTTYVIQALSSNEAMGTVEGSGTYAGGTEVILTAVAKKGYHFTHWHDDVLDNPRTIVVNRNATYYAYFWLGTDIEDTEMQGLYVSGMQLHIDGYENEILGIWSLTGQTIYCGEVKQVIQLPYHGVFILRIGNRTAKIVI